MQLVPFDTWSHMVGQVLKSSLLDHIYVDNVKLIKNDMNLKVIRIGNDNSEKVTRPSRIRQLLSLWVFSTILHL